MTDLKPCAWCGRSFQPTRKNNIYCSQRCSIRGRAHTHYNKNYEAIIAKQKVRKLREAQRKANMNTELLELFQDADRVIYLSKQSRWYDGELIANLDELKFICDQIHLKIALPFLNKIESGEDSTNEASPTLTN